MEVTPRTYLGQRLFAIAGLVAAVAIFVAIGAHDLSTPGVQHDEAADAVIGVEFLTGQLSSAVGKIRISGAELPLMMLHHIGPTTIYTSIAGFAVLGISVESLRMSQLAVGILALVLLWQLAREWFSEPTAGLAALLCGSAPTFVWWSRAGANWTVPLLPIGIATMLALTRWWRRRGLGALALAAFLFGLGVTTKILFLWLAVPLALTGIATLRWRRSWSLLRELGIFGVVVCATALALGLLPLLVHNWPVPHTLHHIVSNAVRTGVYGHDNLAFLHNLRFIIGEYLRALGGDTLAFAVPGGGPLVPAAYLIGVAYLAVRVVRHRRLLPVAAPQWRGDAPRDAERTRLCLLLLTAAVVPLATVSTSGIGATYLFLIFPFAYLTIAATFADALAAGLGAGGRAGRRAVPAVVAAAAAALVVSQVATNVEILAAFARTGGQSFWSRTIALVADCLATKYAGHRVVAMDWGFARSVEFLTLGRTRMIDGFEARPTPSEGQAARCRGLLDDADTVFVFHAPWTMAFKGYRELLEETAASVEKRLVAEEVFCEWDGRPNAIVMRACALDDEQCGEPRTCAGSCGP